MRRPLVSIAASLALGILAGEALHSLHVPPPAPLAVAAAVAGLTVFLLLVRISPRWCFLAALAAIGAAGSAYMISCRPAHTSPALVSVLPDEPQIVRVRGFIASVPEELALPPWEEEDEDRFRTRFVLEVAEHFDRGAWRRLPGRLRVLLAGRLTELTRGDGIEVSLSARRSFPPGNPGQFDYGKYLSRRGIAGTGWIADADGVVPTGETKGLPGVRQVLWLERRIKEVVDERLPERAGAILKCLILGERRALAEDQQKAFRATGTAHLFSVSGLHVGLIAGVFWYVLLGCGVRHRAAAVMVVVLVLFYAIMAGFRPSVLRATVMCCIVCGAFVFNRLPNIATSLALALIIVLLWEPAELFSPGLQLSFAAVWGIWTFTKPLERALFRTPDELDRLQAPEERGWRDHLGRWILQKTLCVSFVAWIVTFPLAMYHFNSLTVLAPFNTMLLLPAVFLVLVAGLPGLIIATVSTTFATPLLGVAIFGAEVLDLLSGLLAKLPFVVLHLPSPGWPWLLVCYAVLAAIAFREKLRLNQWRIAALVVIPALLYLGLVWRQGTPSNLRVSVLSLGEGNCVLVRFPDGKNLLFDAGSWGKPHCGEQVIAPALWSAGVRRLDLVVLSHSDTDHYNGFIGLAGRIKVGRVALSRYFDRHEATDELVRTIESLGVEVVRVGAGSRITGFGDAQIDVLWPPANLPVAEWLSDNELCCVLRLRSEDGSILLTGDFGRRGAEMLLARRPDLEAELLQVPHHGRPDSMGRELADAIRPRIALVPGGRYAEDLRPYADHSEHVLLTDDCGMITVELLRGETPEVRAFLRGNLQNARARK